MLFPPLGESGAKPRYYLIGVVPFEGKALLWHYGIELQPGSNLVTLDDRTGSVIR